METAVYCQILKKENPADIQRYSQIFAKYGYIIKEFLSP